MAYRMGGGWKQGRQSWVPGVSNQQPVNQLGDNQAREEFDGRGPSRLERE